MMLKELNKTKNSNKKLENTKKPPPSSLKSRDYSKITSKPHSYKRKVPQPPQKPFHSSKNISMKLKEKLTNSNSENHMPHYSKS